MPKRQLQPVEHIIEPERDEQVLYLQDYAVDYFTREWASEFNYSANIGLFLCDSWEFLRDPLNLNPDQILDLKESVKYQCPFSGNDYLGAYPVGYVTSTKPKLEKRPSSNDWVDIFLVHLGFKGDPERELSHIGQIGRSLMGHGFTLESIGHGSDTRLTDVIVQINKSEYLIFKVWKQRRD